MIGVTELSLAGRGPKRAFVFDEHRLALPCWAAAGAKDAVLITFDRHFDTVPPMKALAPGGDVEQYAHKDLDPRNFDHILAAMQLGLISHAIIIARARPPGSVAETWNGHELISAPTLDALLQLWKPLPPGPVLLDFDLDCFTTSSDADPTTTVPWPLELIRDHVLPRGSDAFWAEVLPRCIALTFAREPKHCGGLVAGGRLFELAARVVFAELLKTDVP